MRLGSFLLGGVAGATLAYMLDPDRGRRRRVMARERFAATLRRGGRRTRRLGRRLGADAYGVKQKVTHLRPEDSGPTDDVTLTRRVESELFRDPDLPKGRINISAQNGVVVLRGALERPDQINDLETRVRKVHGVHAVENFLHLQGTPAPNKVEALQADGASSPAAVH
jgi:hypothetical protein